MSSKLCGCGGTAGNTASKVKAHEKTKKHQNWLASQQTRSTSSSGISGSSGSGNSGNSTQPPHKKVKTDKTVNVASIPDPVLACFEKYKDPEERIVSMDGIMDIMQALDFDPATDVRVLVLLWRLQTDSKGRRNPSEIAEADFLAGMKRLSCTSITDLKAKIPCFDLGFLSKKEFTGNLSCRLGCRQQTTTATTFKTIDTESVLQLLPIVLDTIRAPHLTLFTEFLTLSSQTRITFDQWDSFLPFNEDVALDLSNYEDDGAWPLLFDEYVEWVQTKRKTTLP